MLTAKACPLCADIGIESKPRVGFFVGMYQIFAVCECTRCESSVMNAIDIKKRPAFIPAEDADMVLEKTIREWNKRL